MRATFTLTGPAAASASCPTVRTFDAAGGTIGRGTENDWVLDDPGRLLSKTHCVVALEHDRFTLKDVSTNGVYLNGSADRIERGHTVVLADGDRLLLGDYEVQVSIAADDAAAHHEGGAGPDAFAALLLNDDRPGGTDPIPPLEEEGVPPEGGTDEVFARVYSPYTRAFEGQNMLPPDDSLFGASPTPSDFQPYSEPDHVPAEQQFFQPPTVTEDASGPVIPDDWDSDLPPAAGSAAPAAFGGPASDDAPFGDSVPIAPGLGGGQQAGNVIPDDWDSDLLSGDQPSAGRAAATPTAPAPASVGAPAVPGTAIGPLAAFLEGAGLAHVQVPDDQADEVLRRVGATFRDLVAGMRDSLTARTALKSELRIDQTMLRPEGNNPLKFSDDLDEALIALVMLSVPGFLPPQRAVREGFADLKAHQMGVMAGMQAAVKSLLQQFDPDRLAGRLDRQSLLESLLPATRKAKYWELYEDRYHEIAAEAEQDFHGVFGKEFATAYEAHIKKQ